MNSARDMRGMRGGMRGMKGGHFSIYQFKIFTKELHEVTIT